MRTSAYLLLGLLLAGRLPCPLAARAQDIGPALNMNLMTGWAGGEAVRYDLEKRAAAAGTASGKTSGGASKAVRLTYAPTPALRRQTVESVAARLQAGSPAGAQAVRAAFGPGKSDYGQLYRTALRTTAYADNDAAAALAAYLELGYQVVHGLKAADAITPGQERGLRAQAAGILGQNARLQRDPAAVARLGEEMKLQTVILLLGWQDSQKQGQEAAFRTNIAAQFRQGFGLDLGKLRLTNQGFAPN